jgi:hypothetical protein
MRYWPVICPSLPANAMALYPFMLFKNRRLKADSLIINHEKIHFQQQIELLILPFYLLYLINYCINLVRYRNHDLAYYNICFEKEAYANDQNLNYLKGRRLYSWLKHF